MFCWALRRQAKQCNPDQEGENWQHIIALQRQTTYELSYEVDFISANVKSCLRKKEHYSPGKTLNQANYAKCLHIFYIEEKKRSGHTYCIMHMLLLHKQQAFTQSCVERNQFSVEQAENSRRLLARWRFACRRETPSLLIILRAVAYAGESSQSKHTGTQCFALTSRWEKYVSICVLMPYFSATKTTGNSA